jgi:uracil permease
VETISAPKKTVLGLQHTVAMFGATVLVPLLVNGAIAEAGGSAVLDPGVTLLAAGLGTLIFHVLTKMQVPVFLGSSFAFMPPMIAAGAGGASWGTIGGGIAAAGVIYLLVAGIAKVVGPGFIRRLFPPVVTGPVIAIIGITLAPVAIDMASADWLLAVVTLGSVVIASIFFRGLFRMLPILTGVVVGYVVAAVLGRVEYGAMSDAAWVGAPTFTWGSFDWEIIVLIAPVALVTMIEHVGDIVANGRVVKKDFLQEPGLHRTYLGDGVATILAGLIGGPANTTYSENTGVLAVTRVYDPSVLRIGAVFAVALGFIPKLAGLLATVPVGVLGGVSIVLFGMIASVGMRTLSEAELDFSQSRNLLIVGLILVFGLGVSGLDSLAIGDVSISGLALAAAIGVVANLVLPDRKED